MKYLLLFLCFFIPKANGFWEDLPKERPPFYRDTILHKIIRAAARDHNDGFGRDSRLKKRVRNLLQGDAIQFINVINEEGETPLLLAVQYPLTTKLLLQKGADPNLVNQLDVTVFQFVLIFTLNPHLLKIYFQWSQKKRPDINAVIEHGLSALQHKWSHPEMKLFHEDDSVSFFQHLWGQFDSSLIHDDSLSPLQFILYDIFLSTKYADIQKEKDIEYHGGSLTAYTVSLFEARRKWMNFFENRQRRKQIALLLINEGADLTYRDPFGKLPLHQAVRLYDPEIAERIIKKGGTLYLTNQDREDIIQLAVEQNYDKVVQLLSKKPFHGEMPFREKFLHDYCHKFFRIIPP